MMYVRTLVVFSIICTYDWLFGSWIVAAMPEFNQRLNDIYQIEFTAFCVLLLMYVVTLYNAKRELVATTVLLMTFCEDLAYWLLVAFANPFDRSVPNNVFPTYLGTYLSWIARNIFQDPTFNIKTIIAIPAALCGIICASIILHPSFHFRTKCGIRHWE